MSSKKQQNVNERRKSFSGKMLTTSPKLLLDLVDGIYLFIIILFRLHSVADILLTRAVFRKVTVNSEHELIKKKRIIS